MLAQCPAGADVIDEDPLPPDAQQVARSRVVFRCRSGKAEAPAQVTAPAVAAPDPRLRLQLELDDVRDSALALEGIRPQYGGPIAMLVIGVGLSAAFVPMTIIEMRHLHQSPSDADEHPLGLRAERAIAGVTGSLALSGLGLTTAGIIWLTRRVHARRERQQRYEGLRTREHELEKQLDISFDPLGQRLVLFGRF